MDDIGDVVGYYEKRDCPGNRFLCLGKVHFLRREKDMEIYLFTPYNSNLKPVEAIKLKSSHREAYE